MYLFTKTSEALNNKSLKWIHIAVNEIDFSKNLDMPLSIIDVSK